MAHGRIRRNGEGASKVAELHRWIPAIMSIVTAIVTVAIAWARIDPKITRTNERIDDLIRDRRNCPWAAQNHEATVRNSLAVEKLFSNYDTLGQRVSRIEGRLFNGGKKDA